MSDVMPDDDKPKGPDFADLARQRFEEARREFEDDEPQKKPAGDAGKQDGKEDGKQKTLRVVPYQRRTEPWAAADWLPTGEAVVKEMKRKHAENFYHVVLEGETYQWNAQIWDQDQTEQATRLTAELCREIGEIKKKSVRKIVEGTAFIHGVARRFREEVSGPLERFDVSDLLCTPEDK